MPCIIKTDKTQIVVKIVKEGVFVFLNAIHIYTFGWVTLCVVGGMDFICFKIHKQTLYLNREYLLTKHHIFSPTQINILSFILIVFFETPC